jgi:hypothetical protein
VLYLRYGPNREVLLVKYKVGDEVVWFHDLSNPSTMQQGTVTKLDREWAWINDYLIHQGFIFPVRVKDELTEIVKTRQQLKKAWEDSIRLVYQLSNAIIRGDK